MAEGHRAVQRIAQLVYHDPQKWHEFKIRYFRELEQLVDQVDQLKKRVGSARVTLVYAAKNMEYNNAVALKSFLDSH